MVVESMLDILRCPACVTRQQAPDPGQLDKIGSWLVCRDCHRKYPIRDGIPVMLIEEGNRHINTPVGELPGLPED